MAYDRPEGCPLSPGEYDVACYLAQGLSYKQIALERSTSVQTCRTQAHTAFRRVGVNNSAQLVAVMARMGWLRGAAHEAVDLTFEESKVTHAQHLYHDAFMRFLQGSGPKPRVRYRAEDRLEMKWMLQAMRFEHGHATKIASVLEQDRWRAENPIEDAANVAAASVDEMPELEIDVIEAS